MTTPPQPEAPAQETRADSAEAAAALCDRLLAHTGDLIAVLERETSLLRHGKPQEIAGLYARKTALSTALTHDISVFRRDLEFIRRAVPERIATLKEQHSHLEKSLTANHDALAAMKSVSESMLATIAAKVSETRSGPEVYGKDAGLAAGSPNAPAAISVDRTL